MKRVLLILAGLALVCAVIYLVATNGAVTDFQLTPTITLSYSLGALMVASFLCGAVTVLIAVMVQAGGRALLGWRDQRRERNFQRFQQMEERGEQLMWQGDARQGRALLEKAYKRQPDSAYAVLALAASYRATGEVARERQFLRDAANAHHHTNPDVLIALAEAHRHAGDRNAALEVLERLRALHPRAPRVLSALRDAYIECGRWHEAIAPQETLVSETRDANQANKERELLTIVRYQDGLAAEDANARVTALEGLAERRSLALPVAVSLGDALVAAGRTDEAVAVWDRALRATPQTVLVERLARIATDAAARGRISAALRRLKADQCQMDHVRLHLAHLHLQDNQVNEASDDLRAIEGTTAAPGFLHRVRAELHRQRGEVEQAMVEFAQADGTAYSYQCRSCGRGRREWSGVCPSCRSWNSLRAIVEIGKD